MKICNVCKTVLEDSAIYCPRCTNQSFSAFPTKLCPFCNTTVAVGTIVCSNCHKILPPEEHVKPIIQCVPHMQPFNGKQFQSEGNDFAVPKFTPNTDFVAPKINSDNGHNFNPNERLVQVLPAERLEDLAFDRVILESENVNFGRPEQYAEVKPVEEQPPILNSYDIVDYELSPFKPIPTNDKYENFQEPNEEGKVLGFSESSARLNEKINSKITKKNKTPKKGDLEDTELLFENLDQKFNDERIAQPQFTTKEEAEKLNKKNNASGVQPIHDQHENSGDTSVNTNEQIVKKAFSDLNSQHGIINKNEGTSQTFIYNQLYPTPPVEQQKGGRKGSRNSTIEEEPKNIRQKRKGSGTLAAFFSLVFLIAGLVASLLLVEINFLYDKFTGIEVLLAYLPSGISNMFPIRLLEIMGNGYLMGTELMFFKAIPFLYMGAVGLTALSILSHFFCFKATHGRRVYLIIIGNISLILSASVWAIMWVLFNFATIGYGIMFLAVGTLLSILSLAAGYRNYKK